VLVTEPYYRSLETVRRLAGLAAELHIPTVTVLANKVRSDEERAGVAEFCERHELDLVGAVPWGDAVLDADGRGQPILDADPVGPVVAAVRSLVGALGMPTTYSNVPRTKE
jgi:CO dehydrogenase maturation factor